MRERKKSARASAYVRPHARALPSAYPPGRALSKTGVPASQVSQSIRDGIADGLGLVNDRDPRVTWVYAQRRTPKSMWGVEVSIVAGGAA